MANVAGMTTMATMTTMELATTATKEEAAWATSGVDLTTEFDLERWIGRDDWQREEEEEEEEEYFSIISPNWESAMETWGKLWPFHLYFFGALFLLLLSQVGSVEGEVRWTSVVSITGRWADGQIGRRANGQTGGQADGQTGQWADR